MRAATTLGLTLLLLGSSVSHARSTATKAAASRAPRARGKARVLSAPARAKLAEDAVKSAIAAWITPGSLVSVRAGLVPFNGDARNPITGQGPVEVFVDQQTPLATTAWAKLRARLSRWSKQKYLVHVGADGKTEVMERISLAPQWRFARMLRDKLPLHALFADFYRSRRAGEGLWTALGASGAIPLSPMLSGALFMRLAQVVREGIASQSVVRDRALDETVTWAKAEQASSHQWPTLMETYRAYVDKIDHIQRGVRPLELGRFAAELSIRQL